MFNFKQILGGLVTLAFVALPTQASQLVLDSFNYNPELDLTVNSGATTGFATDTVTSVESLATAVYELNYTSTASGAVDVSGNVEFVSEGLLSYGESPGADATLQIAYSFPGGAVLDLTGYSDFYFDVTYIDGSGGFDVLLTLVDGDGTAISASYNITSTGIFLASLTSMMPGADFDFTQVASATALISSVGLGDDFSLDSVGLVPAPTALTLLGLGLLGLGLRSRKII